MKLPREKHYPKSILVGCNNYTVKFVRKIDGEKDTYGITCNEPRFILIKKGLSDLERFKTFVHEVIHAIEFEHNIQIKHKAVYKLEEGICDFIVNNFNLDS